MNNLVPTLLRGNAMAIGMHSHAGAWERGSRCQQYGATHIRVFGSVARREENAESDIDFVVEFPRGYDLFKQRMALAEALQHLLKRNIDLIPEHELNHLLSEQILSEAVEL